MVEEKSRLSGAWPFSSSMLVVLAPPLDKEGVQKTILQATAQAARPALLRFALPGSLQGQLEDDSRLLFYEGTEPLCAAAPLVTDEKHFLLLAGVHGFSARWDAALTAALRSLDDKPTLLSASITPSYSVSLSGEEPTRRATRLNPGSWATLRQSLPEIRRRRTAAPREEAVQHPPEVCLPALKESLNESTASIGGGLPLVNASGAVETLIADPAFVFGSTDFLFDCDLSLDTLSLSAYVGGWRVCVPETPVLWPQAELPPRFLRFPKPDILPGTTVSRFQQMIGFPAAQGMLSAKATLGLFGPADTYPQRMPGVLKLSQKAYAARQQLLETHMPLLVSAFVDLPSPRYPLPFYQLRFGFLKRIESLPLVLYTGGSQERQLRASFPHTHSYPDNTVLPRTLLGEGMTLQQHFARSKPLVLYRAVQRQIEFTHAAWLDMDILPHPVCPDAMPDFEPMMDDRIHLATVNGIPDGSFVLMPVKLVPAVAREAKSITLLDAELKRGFSEELFWERLFQKRPEWFTIHPMPRRRLLFLSTFDSRFLSHAIRPLLQDLPPSFQGTPEDGKRAAARMPDVFKE